MTAENIELIIKLAAFLIGGIVAFAVLRFQVIILSRSVVDLKAQIHDLTSSIKDITRIAAEMSGHHEKVEWRLKDMETEIDRLRTSTHSIRSDMGTRLVRLEVIAERLDRYSANKGE